MPYMQMTEEQFKVPVLKNVIYALRLVWQTDKRLLIGYLLQEGLYAVFSRYLQNILFLKILLDVITGSGDFRTYVGELAAFALLALVVKVAQWEGMRMEKCATKRVLKLLNDRIFEKALSVDVACYENPEFYDKYQRATMVTTNGFFDLICFDFSAFVADVVALVCVMATVAAVHPLYLLFLVPVFFVFAVEVYKSKCVYRRDMSMTANKRMQAYVQRTVYLREYAKDMRTSNIFAVMVRRMEAATKANVRILRDYGVRLFLYSVVSSLLGELLPVLGTYAFACHSGVWDKIASLPRGADTVLTREFDEAGTGLSGGENQKVSTARLFARDFQIAVLDEPSSALDPVAEYKMYENLLQVTENKTVIFISHRLSSAVLSDRILVLADGQVQESGSHRQLMEQNGLYADMFRLQASGYKQEGGAAGAQA